MKNYGKIVIMADTIEQAQAELDTIKALVGMGATCGMGEVEITEEVVITGMPRVTDTGYFNHCISPCGCAKGGNCLCCCDDDDEDIDEYEDENFAMDSDPITRAMMNMMGLIQSYHKVCGRPVSRSARQLPQSK